jgi:hypothetical protein
MIKFIEKMVEFMGWLQLFVFPLIFSSILGGVLYYYNLFGFGLIFLVLCIALGLIVGVWYANRVHRKEGAVNHLSTLLRMPELERDVDSDIEKNTKTEKNIKTKKNDNIPN